MQFNSRRFRFKCSAYSVVEPLDQLGALFAGRNPSPYHPVRHTINFPARIIMIILPLGRPRSLRGPRVLEQIRLSSSSRWQARQLKDQFTREATVQGLKSRAAFKLLQVLQGPAWSFRLSPDLSLSD